MALADVPDVADVPDDPDTPGVADPPVASPVDDEGVVGCAAKLFWLKGSAEVGDGNEFPEDVDGLFETSEDVSSLISAFNAASISCNISFTSSLAPTDCLIN